MWTDFWTFLTPLPPNVEQFTIITWTIFQNFQPPPGPPSGPHGLSMTPCIEIWEVCLFYVVHVIDNKLNIRKNIGIVEDSFSIIYSFQIAVQICMVLLAIFRF